MNAAHARYLEVRRLLLIGRLDEAERALGEFAPTPLPPASRVAHELAVAAIAIRRLQTKAAHAALTRAEHAAREADIAALTAEVDSASRVMNTPAARPIVRGQERPLLLKEVEALLPSGARVVDARAPRRAREVVVLTPPVEEQHAAVLAFLGDSESWSSAALAIALGAGARTAQRALDSLATGGKAQSFGRGRARRWITTPVMGFSTTLLLPVPLPTD